MTLTLLFWRMEEGKICVVQRQGKFINPLLIVSANKLFSTPNTFQPAVFRQVNHNQEKTRKKKRYILTKKQRHCVGGRQMTTY